MGGNEIHLYFARPLKKSGDKRVNTANIRKEVFKKKKARGKNAIVGKIS